MVRHCKKKIEHPTKQSNEDTRREKTKMSKSAINVARNYCSESSIHGVPYILNENHSKLGRLFWIVAVFVALSCTSGQLFKVLSQWFDKPVVTSLDTISLPIENIEFPAVTVCPQGSTVDLMDRFFYNQFEEWLMLKSENNVQASKRIKRQESNGCECNVSELGNLTMAGFQCCLESFLEETYPGVNKNNPTKIAKMMNADDPERELKNEAILLPDEGAKCDENSNAKLFHRMNEKLKQICPDPFKNINGSTCIMEESIEATYKDAFTICKENGGANIVSLDLFEEDAVIKDILGIAIKL